jgi:hypothetical protein
VTTPPATAQVSIAGSLTPAPRAMPYGPFGTPLSRRLLGGAPARCNGTARVT